MTNEPCHECGEPTAIYLEDMSLGEAGPFTLTCENGHEFQVPAESPARVRIAAIRKIVREHSAARIDGYIVDAFTAQMLLKVYESLAQPGGLFERKPEMRVKYGTVKIEQLVALGWRNVK